MATEYKFYCPLSDDVVIGSDASVEIDGITYAGKVAGDSMPTKTRLRTMW